METSAQIVVQTPPPPRLKLFCQKAFQDPASTHFHPLLLLPETFSVRRFWKMNQKKFAFGIKKINKKPLWLLYKIVLHNKRPDGAPWATTVLTFD